MGLLDYLINKRWKNGAFLPVITMCQRVLFQGDYLMETWQQCHREMTSRGDTIWDQRMLLARYLIKCG